MKSLTIIFSCITAISLIIFLSNENAGHSCRWELCPYKGVKQADYKKAVLEYTEADEGTDMFNIDMLHLEYPNLEYDDLDSMLFTNSSKKQKP